MALGGFEAAWGKRYPVIGPLWRRAWAYVAPRSKLETLERDLVGRRPPQSPLWETMGG